MEGHIDPRPGNCLNIHANCNKLIIKTHSEPLRGEERAGAQARGRFSNESEMLHPSWSGMVTTD